MLYLDFKDFEESTLSAHFLLEAFNVINYGSSKSILKKWLPNEERHYPVRRKRESEVKVHVPDHVTCQGFAFFGAKMWNQLPAEIREMKIPDNLKVAIKSYIWENIPSY